MKVSISRKALLPLLEQAKRITDTTSTLPILSCCLLSADGQTLRVSSTDLEVFAEVTADAEVKQFGEAAVLMRVLHDAVRESSSDDLLLDLKEDGLRLLSGKSKFRLRAMSPTEFPTPPDMKDVESLTVPNQVLRSMIPKVLPCVPSDANRYTLNGVCLQIARKAEANITLRTLTTDGHRLSVCERIIPGTVPAWFSEEHNEAILPLKLTKELERSLSNEGDVNIQFKDMTVQFTSEGTRIIGRLIEGKFPDHRAVLPTKIKSRIVTNRESLVASIRRAKIMGDKILIGTAADGESVHTASTAYAEMGESEDVLDGGGTCGIDVSLDISYFQDLLTFADAEEEIEFQFGEDLRPCLYRSKKDSGDFYILMPLRT